MKISKFLEKYKGALVGKTVALTGATGGIGEWLCLYILRLGGNLIMLGRNEGKLTVLKEKLKAEIPSAKIEILVADMASVGSAFSAAEQIKNLGADILIHNAGAYKIPRCKTDCGYDNVFTINFISPYILTRQLMDTAERVVVVGSIAHNYRKTDEKDIDFRSRSASSLVYGNAKRYLMYSHFELQGKETEIAVTHPGITLTGITEHFPKILYFFIKPLMKIVFMKPSVAALSIMAGIFENTPKYSWLGPRFFSVWGAPKLSALKTAKRQEIEKIAEKADEIYKFVENMQKNK